MLVQIVITIILSVIILYLGISILWPFFFSLTARITQKTSNNIVNQHLNRILVMIPAYKEDGVILGTVQSALRQNYPLSKVEIVVIADSMQRDTLENIRRTEAKLIEVDFENSNKSKALNFALNQYETSAYDIVVVLDADNHMCTDFLKIINAEFNSGKKAIQGQRIAKNDQVYMSALDGLSEIINNHIFCKGQYLTGGSSRLSGSGMAFCFSLFRDAMKNIDVINGFDKYLELEIVKRGQRITYCETAKVLDDKVAQPKAFQKQRTRWLAAQYICFMDNWKNALNELIQNRNWDYTQKVILLLLPPKLLFIPILGLSAVVSYVFGANPEVTLFLGIAAALVLTTYLLAIPASYYNSKNIWSLFKLPVASILTLGALLNIHRAKNKFLHTSHHIIKD